MKSVLPLLTTTLLLLSQTALGCIDGVCPIENKVVTRFEVTNSNLRDWTLETYRGKFIWTQCQTVINHENRFWINEVVLNTLYDLQYQTQAALQRCKYENLFRKHKVEKGPGQNWKR